ncbi:DUF3987 domain-containing protein [Pseudoxanthomonas mexicana]
MPQHAALSPAGMSQGTLLRHPAVDASLESVIRNAPEPEPACLYGLVGDVARTGSEGTETNAYAIAANFMAYLGCAVGRHAYLPIGNTPHHPRLFCLHVGRSGRGRKGDAVSTVLRIDQVLRKQDPILAPQIHRGGLSSREGLVALIHDGYRHGGQVVAPVHDKRLWVVESEFSNVLHQGRRDGNTLSSALRDCWDGIDLKPATKTRQMFASDPHVCLSGAISPGELKHLMGTRELTNGFANRFLIFWAERHKVLPFPRETPCRDIDRLARRTVEVLRFVGAGQHGPRDRNPIRLALTPAAQARYADLYQGELNADVGDEVLGAVLERRAPMLLRIAMLLALSDLQASIDACHVHAALGWIRHATASVRHVFATASDERRQAQVREHADRILVFLQERGQATRSQINAECFRGKIRSTELDASLGQLLGAAPPSIRVQTVPRQGGAPGAPCRIYHIASD